ncbi:MAG: O-linked N-acetylglucosamine transferase, SPINDLY family protein [Gammaproteobacteria bacterium]
MFGWLSKPEKNAQPATTDAADRLIAEGNRAEDSGELLQACELYRRAVALAPRYAKAHINLGIALEAMGDSAGAIGSYEQALAADPANPAANYNLGKLLHARGEPSRAQQLLTRALQGRPDFPEARIVLASVLASQGKSQEALAEFEAALQQRPGDFGALYHYAGVLRTLNRLDDAGSALRRALAIDPDNLDARAALFHVLEAQGDPAGAAAELEAVLRQRPEWADALYNYGCVLRKLMRPAQAEEALRRAIAVEPRFARAYRALGGVLLSQCRIEEALSLYRSARERAPEDFDLASAELFALNASERISDAALFARHAEFGRRLEQAYPARFAPFPNPRDPGRRLRIGYVSGDFSYHVITLFMLPVMEHHDRSAHEVFCYSTSERVDDFTRRLSARADVWRPSAALSDAQLAEAIHTDRIDILVDLAGHSGEPQLRVFAQRPAPVQATWLGYLNTTGMTRIDYRISDCHADPPGMSDLGHTETLSQLPHSQWCYRPFMSAAPAAAPPCLRNGYVTFGSFNQALKLSQASRKLWIEILSRLPGSRLTVLGIPQGRAQDDLLRELTSAGIAMQRVSLVPYVSLQDYFRWFDAVDIAFDTTPYSGGTTTCDALWMGVPVLTVPGTRPASRSSASILTTAGLSDWIAPNPEEYVGKAIQFSANRNLLADLRSTLRARMQASPLMDEARFTRDLENLYRRMWRQYCNQG